MSADDVGAEDLAVLRVADDLHETVGLAGGASSSIVREQKLADLVVELFLPALCFSESNGSDFRMTVRRVRDVPVVDAVRMLSREQLGDDHALT